jgi:multicomponent Na+:H+ antiporter subunit G
MIIISNILLVLSWVLIITGLIGIGRFDSLYSKLLTGSKIDTAAVILILLAMILRVEVMSFQLKLFIILSFLLITSPISNHMIAFSAYFSGIEIKERDYDS